MDPKAFETKRSFRLRLAVAVLASSVAPLACSGSDLGERVGAESHAIAGGNQFCIHYQPLHASVMGQRFGGKSGDCPVAERVAERLLRLPLFTSLTTDEQHEVIEAVTSFVPGRQGPS